MRKSSSPRVSLLEQLRLWAHALFGGERAPPTRREGDGPMTALEGRTRWFALYVLCLGTLMIVLDTTIVGVALPSIRSDLGFSETSLA